MKYLTLSLILVFSQCYSPLVYAYSNIWKPPPSKQNPPPVQIEKLNSIRQSSCGAGDESGQPFGETAFLRGEIQRKIVPEALTRAMVASNISQNASFAEEILTPFINSESNEVSSIARLHLAFLLLRTETLERRNSTQIRTLLQAPNTIKTDTAYLKAVLYFRERQFNLAHAELTKAINHNPRFANAHILMNLVQLSKLRKIPLIQNSCSQTVNFLIDKMSPLLELGACPLHIAHINLATQRYVEEPKNNVGQELEYIRQTILAYVSRNNSLQKSIMKEYEVQPNTHKICHNIMQSTFKQN